MFVEHTHKIIYSIIVKYVIDTSTLISLTRINSLDLLAKLNVDLLLSDKIYAEAVIEGEKRGFTDATVIKAFINEHEIKPLKVKKEQIMTLRGKINKVLAAGDEAVLSLAMQEKSAGILTDDDGLGKIAVALGYAVAAAPDLLLKGLRRNIYNIGEFETFIRGLVIENRLSSVVAELYLLEAKNAEK